MPRNYNQDLEEQLFVETGKKGRVSLTHLLDISFQRESEIASFSEYKRSHRKTYRHNSRPLKTLNLQGRAFINANYRFIVRPNANCGAQLFDPNLCLEFEDICRVIVKDTNACPICLDDEMSVAPRMVKCGHCFCYTCLLQFFVNGGKECPLCSTKISGNTVYPVIFDRSFVHGKEFDTPKPDRDSVFTLMAKPQGSAYAFPKHSDLTLDSTGVAVVHDMSTGREIMQNCRIMKGDVEFLVQLYQDEISRIKETSQHDKVMYDSSTEEFVNDAIAKIEFEVEKLRILQNVALASGLQHYREGKIEELYSSNPSQQYFYYYQTNLDSSIIYLLSNLDIKILKSYFKSYDCFPTTMINKVENITFGEILNEDNIKKYKFLSHLPFGTELAFIDLSWQKGQNLELPSAIYQRFKNEIQTRTRNNKKKSQIENKNKKIAQEDLERKTREFYRKENEGFISNTYRNPVATDVPLSVPEDLGRSEDEANGQGTRDSAKYTTSVWGTKVIRTEPRFENEEELEDIPIDMEALHEFTRRQEEEQQGEKSGGGDSKGKGKGKRKGNKKKLVLISSSR